MKKDKKLAKHFPYQHPTFGRVSNPKTPRNWEDTVFYWWWEYLRRNEDYIETCVLNGTGLCAKTYTDFGDVRNKTFKEWWSENDRGATLFANRDSNDTLRIVEKHEVGSLDPDLILLSLSLDLPMKHLVNRFIKLVGAIHKPRRINKLGISTIKNTTRGRQYAKSSNATYKFEGQPNIKALKFGLYVYDLAKQNPHKTKWEIAMMIPDLQPKNRIVEGDKGKVLTDKKNVLSATISRYIKRARDSIKLAGQGQFPKPKKTTS
jgi:hypothetical protein